MMWAVRRETHCKVCCYRKARDTVRRSGVTELPGLTSDPIYTADRRGGILISFGPIRRPERVLNPSSWPRFGPGAAGVNPTEPRLHSHRNALLYLRASDHARSGLSRVVCGCNFTQDFPLYKGIEPARTAGSRRACFDTLALSHRVPPRFGGREPAPRLHSVFEGVVYLNATKTSPLRHAVSRCNTRRVIPGQRGEAIAGTSENCCAAGGRLLIPRVCARSNRMIAAHPARWPGTI